MKTTAAVALFTAASLSVALANGTNDATNASNKSPNTTQKELKNMNNITYRGATYLVRLDNGVVFRNTYSADGKSMRYEVIAGMPVSTEEVALHTAEISAGVHFVSWVERSGTTVSHVLDLNQNTVQAFWTWQEPAARRGDLHKGTLERVSTSAQ